MHVREGFAGEPFERVLTDADGAATVRLPADSKVPVLRAESSDGAASSGDFALHFGAEDGAEVLLVLHPVVELRGTVRTESGDAVAGAQVRVGTGLTIGGGAVAQVEPVTTGFDGEFAIRLDGVPCTVRLEAARGERRSASVKVRLPAGAERQLELVLPDADYEVAGIVRDADGRPIAGALVLLDPDSATVPTQTCDSSSAGRFEFLLKEPGGHLLAARSRTHASSRPVSVTTDPARRAAWVELTIEPTARVAGRVVRPSGEPFAGIPVGGHPVDCDGDGEWLRSGRFGTFSNVEPGFTDEEGRFLLEGLHASCLYELVCTPDPARPHCWVRESPVHPGTDDLVVVVDEARIRGGVLAGTATRGGVPVDRLDLWRHERPLGRAWMGPWSREVVVDADGTFRLEGLTIGSEYFVQALTRDAAPLWIGPWTATDTEHRVDLAFGLDGELKARVRYADGSPARDCVVTLAPCGDCPGSLSRHEPRGPEGLARFVPLAAGRYGVFVERDGDRIGPTEVEVVAGHASELEIDLGER